MQVPALQCLRFDEVNPSLQIWMPLNILSSCRHFQKCYPFLLIQKVTVRNMIQSPNVFLGGQVDLCSWVKCSQELLLCRGTRKANPSHPLGTTLHDTATRQRQTTERNYSQMSVALARVVVVQLEAPGVPGWQRQV